MTYEEAIKNLQKSVKVIVNSASSHIAKKPRYNRYTQGDSYLAIPKCYMCYGDIEHGFNYCPTCGQKIDWGQ